MSVSRVPRTTVLILLLAAAVLPYFINLGVSSIWDANEAFYAQTPREMMAAGDYVNPSFNFQLRYNKPVFSYWEVVAAYKLFGISEFSERLPIAIGGLVLIATAYALGGLIGGTESGLFAGLVLATSPRVMLLARRIVIDVDIAMFTGLVLLFFALSETRPSGRRRYLILMYIAAGLGVLTKGPVAVFLPGLVFFVYLASQRRLADLRRMMLPIGALIGLAIVAPWYYLVYRQHGWEYIRSFVLGENLDRYAAAVGDQSRGALFYVPVMFADLFPWSGLLPVALWWGFRERANPVVRLLLIWICAVVLFFSFSGTKEDLYILPIVTAEAALIGAILAARERYRRPAVWSALAGAILLAIAGGLGVWVFEISRRYALQGAGLIGAAALAGGMGAAIAAARGRLWAAGTAIAGTLVLVLWCLTLRVLPDFERYKPVRPFAEIIRTRASEGGIVGYYKFALPSLVYYLDRPVMEVTLPDHLRAVFYSRSDVHVVMPEAEYQQLKGTLPVPTYVLDRRFMFDLRPMNFLSGSELPRFVLISNRPAVSVLR